MRENLKKQLVLILVSLPVIFGAAPSLSQEQDWNSPFSNIYVDISGGANFQSDSNVRGGTNTEMKFGTGYGFSASLGYAPPAKRGFLHHVRVEGEVAYRTSDIDNIATVGRGTVRNFAAMANAFYDFKNASFVTPYVGLGFGVAQLKLEDNLTLNALDETDLVPAYQIMAGLSYDPKPQPFATLHLGYRFFNAMSDPGFRNATTGLKSKYEYATHAVELGLRLNF